MAVTLIVDWFDLEVHFVQLFICQRWEILQVVSYDVVLPGGVYLQCVTFLLDNLHMFTVILSNVETLQLTYF